MTEVAAGGAAHRAWIDAARPPAPAALLARVGDVLAAHPEWDALGTADALARAGETLLAGVLARSGSDAEARDRANALDLLAADACVTWAFEAAASNDVDGVPERAGQVMQRILSLTGPAA